MIVRVGHVQHIVFRIHRKATGLVQSHWAKSDRILRAEVIRHFHRVRAEKRVAGFLVGVDDFYLQEQVL